MGCRARGGVKPAESWMGLLDAVHGTIRLRNRANNSDAKSLLVRKFPRPAASSALLLAYSCPPSSLSLNIPSSRKYSSPQPTLGSRLWTSTAPSASFFPSTRSSLSDPPHQILWRHDSIFFLSIQCLVQGLPAM